MASLTTRLEHCFTRNAFRSYLAEFLSTFFFVYAAVGSSMSSSEFLCSVFLSASLIITVYTMNYVYINNDFRISNRSA